MFGRPFAPPAVVALLAMALAAAATQTAGALPGDPPSTPVEPANGAAVPAHPDAISVRFTCPSYRLTESFIAGSSYYGVEYSRTGPAVGSDGRLNQSPFSLRTGSPTVDASGLCSVIFGDDGLRPDGSESAIPGPVWWQVRRSCEGSTCPPGGKEVFPVQTFVIQDVRASLAIRPTSTPFAGFRFDIGLTAKGLNRFSPVALERRVGARWRSIGGFKTGSRLGERATLRLPAGRVTLRASTTFGAQRVVSPAIRVNVTRPRAWATDAGDDGKYEDSDEVTSFTIAGRGRFMTGFGVLVAGVCPGGPQNFFIGFPRIPISPDGTINQTLAKSRGETVGGKLDIRARLRKQRLTITHLQGVFGSCFAERDTYTVSKR